MAMQTVETGSPKEEQTTAKIEKKIKSKD